MLQNYYGHSFGGAIVLCLTTLLLAAGPATTQTMSATESHVWEALEPGLDFGSFAVPAAGNDAVVNILRIDPDRFELVLLNASANNNVPLTPRQWAESRELVSVINASMFQEDLLTSVSLMRTRDHINNSYQSRDKTILAFDPAEDDLPEVRIIDRQCDEFDEWKSRYGSLIQSIRMISCDGRNVWRAGEEKSSISSVGIDTTGRVLFIHTEYELSAHDLVNVLLELPLDISRAMYAEGGPQAQLYINAGGQFREFTGRLNPLLGGTSGFAWPLPNVIGVQRKN